MIGAYYKLAALPDEVRAANKIKSKARLDCIAFADRVAGRYRGLTNFVNGKGQLFFYKTPCRDFVNTDNKRLSEWSLTGNNLNFSSIYIDDLEFVEIGYGYPNANRLLSNGNQNPLFEFRNDGYLYSVGAWSGSDRRLKENITDLNNGLNKVLGLKARKFDFIDGFKDQYGFIAQEVQEVIPNAVSVFQEEGQMLAIKMDFIIPHLVKAIQELKSQNDALQSRIETLESK